MIQLIGPGAAGKTTTGAALAKALDTCFFDLDREFICKNGDISTYINKYGYDLYAKQNVEIYLSLLDQAVHSDIFALSSGFMTYGNNIHSDYINLHQQIISNKSTFVLLPSFDLETCVAETVRRQLQRSFARTSEREEEVIRKRFTLYNSFALQKLETMKLIDSLVAEILALL